jgi:hypothetical protein
MESEFQTRSEGHVTSAEEEEGATSQRSGEDNAANRVFDVSEVNVARIVPRVISHHVRLGDEPEDELLSSASFGATLKPPY